MKILITNNHLHTIGGSETWVWTVKNVLERLECSVDVFTLFPGENQTYTPNNPPNKENYDLVLCNHTSCFKFVKENVSHKRLTFISHGTVHPLEHPPQGADRYIAISEEIQLFHRKRFGIKSEIIHNPVDLKEFYPVSELRKSIQNSEDLILGILQGQEAIKNVMSLGIKSYFCPIERSIRKRITNEDLNQFNIVFSLGRGAYESLACGRPVIVYDSRPYQGELYDGLIDHKNIKNLVRFNCSGRALRGKFSTERVMKDISNIVPNTEYYRSIAEQYFNGDVICQQLIQ